MGSKAIVLLSGGIDSGVLLWWARSRGWKTVVLSFTFPGRRKMELLACRRLAALSGSKENFEVDLSFIDPPKASRGCYIPKRNLMYYGVAASLADKIQADFILGGHIRHDGAVFKDARLPFLRKIEALANVDGRKARFLFPFIGFDKKDIIKLGMKLKFPFTKAWSCSLDRRAPCWKCNSCKERLAGFEEAGLKDPLHV